MGCLSSMIEGEISEIIDSNDKLYLIKLNNIEQFSEEDYMKDYDSIRNRLISNTAGNIFYNWIQYISVNIKKIDLRHKSI